MLLLYAESTPNVNPHKKSLPQKFAYMLTNGYLNDDLLENSPFYYEQMKL